MTRFKMRKSGKNRHRAFTISTIRIRWKQPNTQNAT